MKLLAIIPAYNEEESLANTVDHLLAMVPDVDILVINDGSKDRTGAICVENGYNHLDMPVNCGLTAGFQAGMKYALANGYDAAVQFDADGQHLPEYLPVMAKALEENGADIVIASRFVEGDRKLTLRTFGNALISKLIKLTTGTVITDPTSGLRMFNRAMIETYAHAFDYGPEPDTIALLIRKGAKVIEIPCTMQDRQAGESYLNASRAIRYMARTCLDIVLFQWLR
jgi:glycosyltransferase involved in cell wall biosynthesis